ncbi:formate-dependent phosphoribosylglycinamide formyltransferase [Actinomyces sp. B33]|uniref:formate-dependent phosphoribosylglycinamide formyltransferase n=1 Tax=Actinomyces sp. B33 TaxID=2942131 RepID=UPI00233F98CC|nr:formate-dependent phosphoribosylglycinamide formyltransferase [Actinomyces sp. B33]MDC4233278.1 formate-dependent phosphoribosylglycinamide formyltransferase [Actinomyces sp. B33]
MSASPRVPLPARVLLLGSGELGKELTISLQRLGCHVVAADSYPGAPAMQVADEQRVLDMTDPRALDALLEECRADLVVPEVEAIATDRLARAEEEGLRVVPNAFAVRATMDRQLIRSLAAPLDAVRTSAFRFASGADEIRAALEVTGLPAFVKPTMSSSGHGQTRIDSADEAERAWERAVRGARADTGRVIVEEGVDFDCEITLLTVRSWDEETRRIRTSFCEPIGHRQKDGDYVESWQPADVSPAALDACRRMARAVTDALADGGGGSALGLFGVEFFVAGDDAWFSELSPRPHDTGMVTLATQRLSEFDLHARAILGLPVDTSLSRPGASAVVKAPRPVERAVYEGVGEAMASGADVRIFNKPVTRTGRRLAVCLADGEDAQAARRTARGAASLIRVIEDPRGDAAAPAVASLDHD